MKGKAEDETPVFAEQLKGLQLVYDLVYIPFQTRSDDRSRQSGSSENRRTRDAYRAGDGTAKNLDGKRRTDEGNEPSGFEKIAMNERYSRQILFHEIGKSGQEKLLNSRVLLVGCGAFGASHAEILARAGVGFLRIVDRDFVEFTNLQRQTLYSESDANESFAESDCGEKSFGGNQFGN